MKKTKQSPVLTTDDFLLHMQSDTFIILQGLTVSIAGMPRDMDSLKMGFRTDNFGVMLVLSGEGNVRINLQDYALRKGDLLIASPNSLKQVVSFSRNFRMMFIGFTAGAVTWLGMQRKDMTDLMEHFSRKFTPHWKLDTADVQKFKLLVGGIRDRMQDVNKTMYGKEVLMHSFYILLYELAAMSKKYAQNTVLHMSRKEDLIMRFANLVSKQFRTQRSVQAYGRQLNVTPKYLTETVKEISGKTAGEVIDDFVVLEAKVLLADPALSVSQVAHQLNFSDQSFFGKFFKRHVGVSPRQYKEESQPIIA